MLNNYPPVLNVSQVAEILGIGVNKAYELVNLRIIGSKRVGRRILIPKTCLIDYLESSRYNVSCNGRQA
jgi:excisionase family DNA binding protein